MLPDVEEAASRFKVSAGGCADVLGAAAAGPLTDADCARVSQPGAPVTMSAILRGRDRFTKSGACPSAQRIRTDAETLFIPQNKLSDLLDGTALLVSLLASPRLARPRPPVASAPARPARAPAAGAAIMKRRP